MLKSTDRPLPEEIEKELMRQFRYALSDELGYEVKVKKKNKLTPVTEEDTVRVQYYYNPSINKCYFEYELGRAIDILVDRHRFRIRLYNYINENFYYDINIRPQVIFFDCDYQFLSASLKPHQINTSSDEELYYTGGIEDYTHRNIDIHSNEELTPFAIGYWTCINGKYEYIEESNYVYNNMRCYIPTLGKYSDKKIQDFFDQVKTIRDKYAQVELSEEDKMKYFEEYNALLLEYKGKGDEYKSKIEALNNKYIVKTKLNSLIPTIFEEYNEVYKSFFEADLPTPGKIEGKILNIYAYVDHDQVRY